MFIQAQSLLLMLLAAAASKPATPGIGKHEVDVIYGRKDGMALTMDVVHPPGKPNGRGIIFVVSGGWISHHNFTAETIRVFGGNLLDRGYTIFAVVHGSQPRFTIPDAVADLQRSVRFIRASSKRWDIDPDKLGIFGGSAGGHLSLMTGLNQQPGKKDGDPVDRTPIKVAAIVAWFPPTDFLDYGKEDDNAIGQPRLEPFRAAFDFRELNPKTNRYVQISDQKRIEEIERQISPVTHVDETDPPVMLIHGDADNLVPIQQSELLVQKLRDANVEVKLVVRKGMGHGWPKLDDDRRELADWFDAHLLEVTSTAPSTQPAGSRSDTSQAEPSSAQGSRSSR